MIKHMNTSKKIYSACPIKKYNEYMDMLCVLSDKTRQKIIRIFAANKELCANDVAKNFVLSRPTISHHINLLKRSGVLVSRKSGKEIYYSFNKKLVIKVLASILDDIKKYC